LGVAAWLEAMKVALEVRYGSRRVAALRADDSQRCCFRYLDEWLTAKDSFPVSVTLPLVSEETVGGPAHAFFANPLPDGLVRQAVPASGHFRKQRCRASSSYRRRMHWCPFDRRRNRCPDPVEDKGRTYGSELSGSSST
jgi:HipA-like protein